MKKYTQEEIKAIIELHKQWVSDNARGDRADLRGADLRWAKLGFADLRGADLRWAKLSGADLRCAKTDYRYIIISCIGNRKDSTTYCYDTDTIWCGCFSGTLEEFKANVLKNYPDKRNMHHKEYIGAINYIKRLK